MICSFHRVKKSLAVGLCLSQAFFGVPGWANAAGAPSSAKAISAKSAAILDEDARILHALNRFTFGPRFGDVESVKAMGLDRWFDQQLHPAKLNNAALDARLAQFPAMQSTSEDLLYRLPSNAIIRQAIDGKLPVPAASPVHSIYENQMARVTTKKQEKAEQQTATVTSGQQMAMVPSAQTVSQSEAASLPDPKLVPAILSLPPQQRLTRLTAMPQAEFDSVFKSLKGPQRQALNDGMTPEMKETLGGLENPERQVVDELMADRLTRDIYSSAQLQEVMTDFWLNHFNVFLHKNETTPYELVSFERDVIRPRALGKFEDLLEATAHSPAMLEYLDNSSSIGPDSIAADKAKIAAARQPANKRNARQGLNENYARELMELHTLGVNGGYTQADVTQVARVLTGWTVERPQRGGEFKFDANRHEPGEKKVLGKKFKENGEREGRDLLHMLATRPATARFLSRKLAIRFASDDPPQSLVDRMAKSYLKSGGDISAVLKTMFKSPEFWSPDVYRVKLKTPLEYVVSAARASNAEISNMQPLANALREMGMPLYGCVPPTGYKWVAADWISTGALVNRMNFALSLAANRLPGISSNWLSDSQMSSNMPSSTLSPETEEARLEASFIAGGVGQGTRSAVLQQFQLQISAQGAQSNGPAKSIPVSSAGHSQTPTPLEKQDQLLAGLLLGSPEFQRR